MNDYSEQPRSKMLLIVSIILIAPALFSGLIAFANLRNFTANPYDFAADVGIGVAASCLALAAAALELIMAAFGIACWKNPRYATPGMAMAVILIAMIIIANLMMVMYNAASIIVAATGSVPGILYFFACKKLKEY